MIDILKTGNLLSKNTAEKSKILYIKDKNINAINSKNLGNVDIIIEERALNVAPVRCFQGGSDFFHKEP